MGSNTGTENIQHSTPNIEGRREGNTLDIDGGGGRNRPDFPAVAPLICLILLGIQAKSFLSDRIIFNPIGVRFGVRFPRSADTVTYEECELSALNSPAHPEEFCGRRHVQVCP